MTKLEKIAFPIIFVVVFVAYIMSRTMSNDIFSFHWMVREDGFLEWLTVSALFSSAIVCWFRSWTLRKASSGLFLCCTAMYGVVLFFGMLEEISWGQRIFGIETPEFIAETNAQKETNLHNLVIGGTSINKLVFGKILAVGLVGFLVLVPVAYRQSPEMRQLCDRLAIPVPRLQHTLAILAVVLLVETSRAAKRGEITEFALTSFVFLLLLNPLNIQVFRKPPKAVKALSEQQIARRAAA
ncbi:MAG: hypothetical protein WKF77_25490 [Planctomycetaceae bacterium]